MKIWIQSSTSLGVSPLWEPYERNMREYCNKICREGNEVVPHGVARRHEERRLYAYFARLNEEQVIENAIQAEKDGYEAFCINCASDVARRELKDVVDMPVVQLLETSLHFACMLGKKFAFLAYEKGGLLKIKEIVREYGLSERMSQTVPFECVHTDLPKYFEDPNPLLEAMMPAAEKMVEEGAEVLIPTCGCLSLVLSTNNIRRVKGAPIMDGTALLIKTAEMLVDFKKMGLERSTTNLSLKPTKEKLAEARKIYLDV